MFSEDKWVGGIESDISTVVTYVAAERWLKRGGTLAFLITGTVFANESSQGFRRFEITRLKLPADYPATFRYLKRFRRILEQRSSFRRFQKKQAWWSLWSTGAYSFARYKVAWREMPGGRFAAAIVAPVRHPLLGKKLVVLDHKLYFVPCKSLKEAAFLTALLNAPIVS